jgi:hypothetical protein
MASDPGLLLDTNDSVVPIGRAVQADTMQGANETVGREKIPSKRTKKTRIWLDGVATILMGFPLRFWLAYDHCWYGMLTIVIDDAATFLCAHVMGDGCIKRGVREKGRDEIDDLCFQVQLAITVMYVVLVIDGYG